MSPLVWQVLQGRNKIAVSLLDAADGIDQGAIWKKEWLQFEGHELFDELNAALFETELHLMEWALANCDERTPVEQVGIPTMHRRRTPEDSRIDVAVPLAEQFDLLRVCDPVRYPAFFWHRGEKYILKIEKAHPNSSLRRPP